MLKKLANSAIVVFGICSFSLPKVLAQSLTNITCSNYWVNPNNGQQECLQERLQPVVTQHLRAAEGQNGNRAYIGRRDTLKRGSVGRVRGIVGNFGRARSVQRSRSDRNTVRISSGGRVGSGGRVSRVGSVGRGHR